MREQASLALAAKQVVWRSSKRRKPLDASLWYAYREGSIICSAALRPLCCARRGVPAEEFPAAVAVGVGIRYGCCGADPKGKLA
jgi:hypothetical protein